MAIWQYKIFIIPLEEKEAFFSSVDFLCREDLDEIEWWKYRRVDKDSFRDFDALLNVGKSWSDDTLLFGDIGSNCVEVIYEKGIVIEISARIDLRIDYRDFVHILCDFALKNQCWFVNSSLKFVSPYEEMLLFDIEGFNGCIDFLDMLGW